MAKFRITARAQIYSIFEVDAENEQEAREKFVAGEAQYVDRDYSDDHLTTSKNNIMYVEEY